ncbi:MAG TPA: GNAT family N-acetyltransferase, partial [Anaerolineae bacterium]
MSGLGAGTYQIERIQSEAQFAAVRGPWSDLIAASHSHPAVFLTWEWVSTWCRHLDPNWESWLLAAWDGAGRLAGVLPWMLVHHRYGPIRLDRLAFMGSNYAYRSHQDLLSRPGEGEAVWDAVMGYLAAHAAAWDVVDLEGLAQGSLLKEGLAGLGGLYRANEPIDCPYTALPSTWEAYEMQHLSANRRQQIRARRRHLERDFPGQVAFKTVSDPAELPEAMAGLVDLHRKRWHGRGQASSFDVPSFLAFHRDLAEAALARGWLRLYLLQVGPRLLAAEYCFLYDRVLFDYQKGMDPDPAWERYSPGQLVLAYALQEAIRE